MCISLHNFVLFFQIGYSVTIVVYELKVTSYAQFSQLSSVDVGAYMLYLVDLEAEKKRSEWLTSCVCINPTKASSQSNT